MLTASCIDWHIENSKNDKKKWYYSASHWRLGDVMVVNIIFCHNLLSLSFYERKHAVEKSLVTEHPRGV